MFTPSPTGEPQGDEGPALSARWITILFGAAICLMAGASAFSYRNAQRSLNDVHLSRETLDATAHLHEILALLIDVGAAEALFELTADERVLEPYNRARAALPLEMARLRALTADDPRQQQRVERLQALQDQQLGQTAETIELRRRQPLSRDESRRAVTRGNLTADVRKVVAEMQEDENRLQVQRDLRVERDSRLLKWAVLGLSAIGLTLLAVAFFLLAGENKRRALAERRLSQLNAQLEDRVRERSIQLQVANEELERDIAERKRLEQTLRDSEMRIRATLDAMLEGCQIIAFDWRYLYLNDVAAAQGRQPRETLVGRTMMDAFPGIEQSDMFATLRESMEQRVHRRMENRFEFADGSASWFELSVEPVPEGVFILSMDVTNRKLAEAERERAVSELRESEARYRRLVDHIREVVFAGGTEGPPLARRLTFVSPQVEHLAGHPPEDFLADPALWSRLLHPEDVANVLLETERALARHDSVVRFYRFYNDKTREYRWIEDTFVPDDGDDGEARGFFATARDVTERWSAQAEAEQLRHRNEVLLDCAGEGICGLDREGKVTFINPKGASLLGYEVEELVGTTMHTKSHHTRADGSVFPAQECRIHAAPPADEGHASEDVMWRKDGTAVPVQSVSTPIHEDGAITGVVVVFQDISERRHLEEMVQQSQKLEAIGRLAGGVAHDFNNILGVITGYGELMGRQIDAAHPARPRLDQVLKAAERAAGLTRQLLTFSRKQVIAPRLLDLNLLSSDLEKMLLRVIGEDVELEVRQAHGLGAVKADPTQMEQIVMNLVVNARDAMPKGGQLTIETANVEFDEDYAAQHPPAQAGRFVMVAVSDTGSGMDPETQRRIFEPFFTTKPVGEGTGLGLATVYGIVKQSGGYVWVYSELGRGTTFKVYLPRVDEQAEATAPTAAVRSPRGTETVLLVEDTESLREMIREVLEEQGYKLLQTSNGEEALSLAQRHQGTIHLLLTDVVMPRMGGADLAKKLASLRPEMRVVYMSGYTDGAISRQGVLREGSTLIEKPFTTDGLARVVRETLDAPKRDS